MSLNNTVTSSSSSRSAKKSLKETKRATPQKRGSASNQPAGLEVIRSSSSSSPLAETYASEEFRRAWEDDIAARVAEDAIFLRKHRGLSQAQLAARMHTSQPKIAGIESGDQNLRLTTIQRLARALRGKVRLVLYPEEVRVPAWPVWWLFAKGPAVARDCNFQFLGWAEKHDEAKSRQHVLGLWQADLSNASASGSRALQSANTTIVNAQTQPVYGLAEREVIARIVGERT